MMYVVIASCLSTSISYSHIHKLSSYGTWSISKLTLVRLERHASIT